MEFLFLYIWTLVHPAFDPCVGNTCFAVSARPAWNETKMERFKSRDEAFAWIRQHGRSGELWNKKTDEREPITVKEIKKTVDKVVQVEEVVGYEIERRWYSPTGLFATGSGTITLDSTTCCWMPSH